MLNTKKKPAHNLQVDQLKKHVVAFISITNNMNLSDVVTDSDLTALYIGSSNTVHFQTMLYIAFLLLYTLC